MVMHRCKRGFTLVELLTVIGLISILLGLLLPSLMTAREGPRKASCLANLKSIAQGALQYATSERGFLPAMKEGGKSTASLGKNNTNAAADSDGNTRQWYLLIKNKMAQLGHFTCASDRVVAKNVWPPVNSVDFAPSGAGPTISFSLAVTKLSGTDGAALVQGSDDGRVIIAADHNGAAPWSGGGGGVWVAAGNAGDRNRNSPNHDGKGQNIVTLGNNASWAENPNCGIDADNIWTNTSGAIEGSLTVKSIDGIVRDSFLRP